MSKRLQDLAAFGGTPTFTEQLHVGHPNLGDRARLLERFNRTLDTKLFSNDGPFVKEFEQRIADYVGVEHCIAMCSGTTALEVAIRALAMTGEVIVPSFTFIATAHALQWQGITPVFCDIEPRSHTIDPEKIESLITPRTTGIIGVHLWGNPCNVDALNEIATRRRLKLLFDSSHAFGCSYKGRLIGSFGDAEVFSFHATKFLNSLEGGALVTNDGELSKRMRSMHNFGFTNYDEVNYVGTNGKMNEAEAAMGLTNLEAIHEFIELNRRNHDLYGDGLAGIEGVTLLRYDKNEKCNYQYVVLQIDEGTTIVTRDQLIEILRAENILARRYFWPGCHLMEPYKSLYPDAHLSLPQTERIAARVLTLPTGQAITPEIIGAICEIIRTACENADQISKFLREKSAA